LADGGDRTIEAGAILIASGSSPARPGFLPWESERVMTNREIIEADDLPASVIVMGGGPLGCEFACLFAELGIRTVQVEMADRLLSKLDPTASRQVARALKARGVELHLSSSIESVQADSRGVQASLADRGRTIEAEALLVAVGRQPNTGQLGLAEVGVATDDDGIVIVDDRCRTNVPTVYAAGDCAETLRHSHLAARMGEVAADNIMGESSADDRCVVPVGVYTHPQVACVGLCGECPESSRDGEMAEYTYSYASGGTAMLLDRNEGLLKLLADPRDGRIGGAVWVGPHAVDMVHEIALAMRNELTVAQVAETIHAHPSLQEALRGVAEDWQHGRPRADPEG
jgi:dihydrolipoamide dehydrogenase